MKAKDFIEKLEKLKSTTADRDLGIEIVAESTHLDIKRIILTSNTASKESVIRVCVE